jgi:hypothetical protein
MPPKTVLSPSVDPEVGALFQKMADEAPGTLSVRSVGKRGEVRMRHEISGRRGRRPYLERQDFSVVVRRYGTDGLVLTLFEVSMRGSPTVLVSGVPSAVLAVVRR